MNHIVRRLWILITVCCANVFFSFFFFLQPLDELRTVVFEILKKKQEFEGNSSTCCVFSLLWRQKCWLFFFNERRHLLTQENQCSSQFCFHPEINCKINLPSFRKFPLWKPSRYFKPMVAIYENTNMVLCVMLMWKNIIKNMKWEKIVVYLKKNQYKCL